MLFYLPAAVQAQMSDDQVVEYITNAQKTGETQSQIVNSLLRKRVTIDQINRIKTKVEKQQLTGTIGNTVTEASRIRTSPVKGDNYLIELEEERRRMGKMSFSERQEYLEKEMDFIVLDSIMLGMKLKKIIFGHDIFNNREVSFEASYNLATPPNYRLGPGDEVIIDIWGASESTVRELISPDGRIFVNNLGPIFLNGMTVKEANALIKKEFGKIYSGINSEQPNSNISITLGQNRTIQIHVMGEVETPGTYSISSFATIFNALYQAGGVNDIGTLRSVKVYRDNKEIVSYDLYDYILNGKIDKDIRLEDNDVVVVGSYISLVNISGKVKRPMYYEMRPEESVSKLLEYSGGFSGDAYKKDIRVVRMGLVEREIYTLNMEQQTKFLLQDGDSITVDSIQTTFSNLVEIKGAVNRPGQFQMGDNIRTVKNLIDFGGGLREDAFLNRCVLSRTRPDKTLENISIDLQALIDETIPDIELHKNDILFIPSVQDIREQPTLTIFGEVAFPGKYQFAENLSIEDLILLAGGLKEAASISKIDVARRIKDSRVLTSNNKISDFFTLSVTDGLIVDGQSDFRLQPFDEVYVRRSPSYYKQQNIRVEGEVVFSGSYSMTNKEQRLSDLIESVGGLTPEAYAKGASLERVMTDDEKLRLETVVQTALQQAVNKQDSLYIMQTIAVQTSYRVGIELDKAINQPGSYADIVLREGDRLVIPQFSNTVKLSGEVMYANTVSFQKGKNLKFYINQAGGYGNEAKRSRAYIVYMNGNVSRANRRSGDLIQPGCEIIVPKKPESTGMSTAEVMSVGSTSASLATIVLALVNLLR